LGSFFGIVLTLLKTKDYPVSGYDGFLPKTVPAQYTANSEPTTENVLNIKIKYSTI